MVNKKMNKNPLGILLQCIVIYKSMNFYNFGVAFSERDMYNPFIKFTRANVPNGTYFEKHF